VTASRPILEADGLGKSFGREAVLKSASFTATLGRITTLMGRNGAGKTTMLRIAVGRLRPDYGRVVYRGAYVPRPSLAKMARAGLMYIAQRSALTPLLSLRAHLEAFARVYDGQERLAEAVEELRLAECMDRRPGALSGGEKQRGSLALAAIRCPECLLMDEPFAGVAPLDRPTIARGLQRLKERGTAVVITGHDVDDLFAVSDEVIWVTAGTTHWLGHPGQAALHDQFRREYLGPRGAGGYLRRDHGRRSDGGSI